MQESSFTPEQQAFIREVVFIVTPTIITSHMEACKWGKKIVKFIYIGLGMGICLTLLGLTTVPRIWAVLTHLSKGN